MGVPIRKSTRRLGRSIGAGGSVSKSKAPMSSTSPISSDPAPVVPIRSVSAIDTVDSQHSPFFLHSADHPGLSLLAERLYGMNYNHLSSVMKITLDAKNKLAFIDGSLPRPDEDTPIFRIRSCVVPAAFQVGNVWHHPGVMNAIVPSTFVGSLNAAYQSQRKDKPTCSHCGFIGHVMDRCYKLHGYPPGWKPR
ncbi:unnamed protein product, partial [Arabidopsis halleri]